MEIKQKTLLESKNGFEQIFDYIRVKILLRTNIRIYLYPKNDTNEYPNQYSDEKYSNIQIFKYIRHTLIKTAQSDFFLVRSSLLYDQISE